MRHFTRIILTLLAVVLIAGCASKTPLRRKQSEALRNLGEAYLNQGNATAAIKELLEAESLYEKDYLLQDDLGKAYAAKNRYETAIRHFQRAIDLQPDYAPAKNNMGSVLLLMKRWDAAINILNGVTDNILYATPHYPLYNLGWAYYNKTMYARAMAYYKEALEIEPSFALPMRGMGLCLMAQGRLADAIAWFEKGIRTAPHFQELQFELAGAYLRAGAYTKSQSAFKKTIAINDNTPLAARAKREMEALAM